jgi:hypothetical protein
VILGPWSAVFDIGKSAWDSNLPTPTGPTGVTGINKPGECAEETTSDAAPPSKI